MKKEALYNLVIKSNKEAKNSGFCNSCFCYLAECYLEDFNLEDFNLDKPFLDWKEKNNIDTACGSVLFYLQDLGIIEILSGAAKRAGGVDCAHLKIKVLRHFQGNKI